jgi:hypothetical protein
MGGWEKWVGAAAVVVVVLFVLHTFAPASIKTSLGIS